MGAGAEGTGKVVKAVLKVSASFAIYCRVVYCRVLCFLARSTLYILDLPGGENLKNLRRNSLEMVLLALSFL